MFVDPDYFGTIDTRYQHCFYAKDVWTQMHTGNCQTQDGQQGFHHPEAWHDYFAMHGKINNKNIYKYSGGY